MGIRYIIGHTYLLLTLYTGLAASDSNAADLSTLRFVTSIYRHGDRNPASTFPTDVDNLEKTWKEGFGELTPLGVRQQYKLGQFIKSRYKGFLSEDYKASEIHVRSTGYNRTIMSALANLAGMYPPKGDQIWNKDLLWQPIPVHSRPRDFDPSLWMDKPCPTVSKLYKTKVFTSESYRKIEDGNRDFLEMLRVKTGRKNVPLMDLWSIFDPLNCETIHSDTHKRPDWVTDEVFNKLVELYRLSVTFYYSIPEIRRLRGALMLNEIASRFVQKTDNSSSYVRNLKYYAYSIHDTTQVALLENLNAYDGSLPAYDQLLLMELHEINGSHIIKMFKKNDTAENSRLYSVPIPPCGDVCKVEKLYQFSLENKPSDWDRECGNSKGNFIEDNAEEAVGILTALCILFFVMFIILLAFYCRLRRTRWEIFQE